MKEDAIAQVWIDALHHFDQERYKLICSTVMSNHIHFIFYKLDRSLAEIMKSLKGYSAYKANKLLLGRKKGAPFWQEESFDRNIRHRDELKIKINYILNNPVDAGLVTHWKDWKYNYIHPDFIKYLDQ